MRRIGVKKILLLIWACALAFGLTYQTAEAEARAVTCGSTCSRSCKGSGGCGAYDGGCSCDWVCADGTHGSTICVL